MSKAVRTILSLVVSMVLFNAVAMAHAGGEHIDKHKKENKEHHSRLSKLAFWRHPKHTDTSLRTAQANHAAPKSIGVKTAQTTPTPHTSAAGKNSQKQAVHARGRAPAKTRPAATKAKPKQTA